ncbi:hypothetical protein VSDG_07864 [Cytospora chrysosperma]|uniref:CSI2 protein n=1 Tax=Cytospora chrysosperma TaxID=252740 RepID=A0A423VJT7_CYTCH|nr:hypothetical protein VSDG_07864 [Valsa sordida]
MGRSRLSLKRSLLLSTVFSLSLLTAGVLAATTADDATATDAATTDVATTTDAATTEATTTEAMPTEGATSANAGESSAAATSASSDMPSLSTGDSSANSDMPTLSTTSAADTSVPTYPAPTVPPKDNAPYLRTSSVPEGTVFICVGAILGAFGLSLLLWRAIIACLLHRSVEKAAMAQHLANDKAPFSAPTAPFYKYSDQDSSQNIASGRGVRRTTRGPIPSSTPSQSNLFFSPTAGATNRDSVHREEPTRNSTHRDSRFLPAGFYAAQGASAQHTDAQGQSISMTNLRPDSRGHGLSGNSMSESPSFGPQRTRNNLSTSSINLNATTGRAPSAFLDDLLDDHPEMFPSSGTSTEPRTNANHPYRQSGGRF